MANPKLNSVSFAETTVKNAYVTPSGAIVNTTFDCTHLKNGAARTFASVKVPYSVVVDGEDIKAEVTCHMVTTSTPSHDVDMEAARLVAQAAGMEILEAIVHNEATIVPRLERGLSALAADDDFAPDAA